MNNPGFVVTDKGVVVVDPGSSVQIGEKLLEKIASVTSKPVIAVFNTHVHGDHWLGNHAMRAAYPGVPIYAHARMLQRVEAGEGEEWLALFSTMTEGAVDGTRVISPSIGLNGGETLAFGGVTFRIYHTGKAHTDNDIMIVVLEEKGMFLGDIVTNQRIPSSDRARDADVKGQIRAIRMALRSVAELFIPGHGRSGGREIPQASLEFLEALYTSVKKYYDAGLSDFEMKDKVMQDLSKYRDWHRFSELGRVISFVYLQIEQESF